MPPHQSRVQSILLYIVETATMKTATIDACVPDDLNNAVVQLSELSGQSISSITEDALRGYLAWRSPQLLDLGDATAAADRGEFASEEEVTALFARYGAWPRPQVDASLTLRHPRFSAH